jgi:hypothetical protein
MQLLDTILAAIGDVAVLLAVYLADRTLGIAQGTEREAEKARTEAQTAAARAAMDRKDAAERAAADRREAELIRQRQRVEVAGSLVEQLFWRALRDPSSGSDAPRRGEILPGPPGQWMSDRNYLSVAMVGLADQLPQCAKILDAATPVAALGDARLGREEVLLELRRLDEQLASLSNPVPPRG